MTFEEEIEKHGYLVYPNVGDSMMPLLRQGRDLMVITRKPAERLKRYDVPLYKRENGQYVLHRILKARKDDYVICGDNRWCREYGITDQQIIGILTEVVRDGKKLSVTDKKYRIYMHMWCDLFYIRAAVLWSKGMIQRIIRKWKQ